MSEQFLFRRDGRGFRPTECATGSWGADRLHGGPVFGLLARAIEAQAADPELALVRASFDLFRAVPLAALEVRTEVVRRAARLCLIQASLEAEGAELVRASALLLRVRERSAAAVPYINVDATVYLTRRPQGEWFCLRESSSAAQAGVSVAEVELFDAAGPVGRIVQARLDYAPRG